MFKKCFKCKRSKPVDQFYAHPSMADGRLGKCKACTKKDSKKRYNTPSALRRIKAYEKARGSTLSRKRARRRYYFLKRENRPGAERVRWLTSNAIRDGRLIKQPCEKCGSKKVEAHHDDYRSPLKVRWLCFKHHRELHGQIVGTPT